MSASRLLGGVSLALAVIVAVALWMRPGPNAIARSLGQIGDDHAFVNGPKAGSTFAAISQRLLADANHCAARLRGDDPRCAARYQAAAYSSVTAVTLLSCTQPGVYQARHSLYTELLAIQALDHDPPFSARVPTIPPVPTC